VLVQVRVKTSYRYLKSCMVKKVNHWVSTDEVSLIEVRLFQCGDFVLNYLPENVDGGGVENEGL
jgi:hypothetical protein